MEYKLICADKCRDKIEKLLDVIGLVKSRGQGDVAIVDKSKLSDDWNHPVAIVLDLDQVDQVERDLKKLVKSEKALISITDKHIIGKHEEKFAMVEYQNIRYFSASSNDVYFHADLSYTCKQKLYELEVNLKGKGFVRINKSEIVNIKQVREIIPWFNSRLVLVLFDDSELIVTKSYTKSFKEYIGF